VTSLTETQTWILVALNSNSKSAETFLALKFPDLNIREREAFSGIAIKFDHSPQEDKALKQENDGVREIKYTCSSWS
jgi:hypothetical protein